jgi:hypothetical protein
MLKIQWRPAPCQSKIHTAFFSRILSLLVIFYHTSVNASRKHRSDYHWEKEFGCQDVKLHTAWYNPIFDQSFNQVTASPHWHAYRPTDTNNMRLPSKGRGTPRWDWIIKQSNLKQSQGIANAIRSSCCESRRRQHGIDRHNLLPTPQRYIQQDLRFIHQLHTTFGLLTSKNRKSKLQNTTAGAMQSYKLEEALVRAV